jgi:hypothetical protein
LTPFCSCWERRSVRNYRHKAGPSAGLAVSAKTAS